jgi:hypothetical protein
LVSPALLTCELTSSTLAKICVVVPSPIDGGDLDRAGDCPLVALSSIYSHGARSSCLTCAAFIAMAIGYVALGGKP